MRYRKDRRSKFLVFWYANSTIWWLPWRSASTPSLCHVSLSSSSCAEASATSMLPHSSARLKRVRSSLTKCSATSGKPFCCRYAMMLCPHSALPRIMASTWSYLRWIRLSLNMYSLVSIWIDRLRPSRSRQYTVLPNTLVRYTGVSSVRMMPLSPLGSAYLMWLSVVYTNTPQSSHAPLFTRMVSCTVQAWPSLRLAMTMACLDSMATRFMSLDQITYLMNGVLSSAIAVRCCTSNSTMRSSLRHSSVPVPA
mmetsp:Transcript_6189/g.15799  ORF Transcript_6189/g.15799 Transcript_6189/m.15799 type:complete len:252 (+) Transcript_6189:464-1219(+)